MIEAFQGCIPNMEKVEDFMIVSEKDEYNPINLYWELKLSRLEFARLLGIEEQSLNRWLCGLRKPNKMAWRLAWEIRRNLEIS